LQDYFLEGKTQPQIDCLKLELSSSYTELLNENNLRTLVDFMVLPKENSFRDVHQRLTVGLDLKDGSSSKRVYLKRHWSEKRGVSSAPHQEAQCEAVNISLLGSHNIPVPELVASGWGYINGRSVAFVAMHEVPGLQGDHFISKYLSHPEWGQIKLNLIDRLSSLSRDFHLQGFNHRDFYLCHFFVELIGLDVGLNMIDLQRVQSRRFFRQRWIVKDLAQMCYSSMKLVSHTDRLRFFLKYIGSESLNDEHKKLIQKISKKTLRMIKRGEAGKDR
jgi:heptose I phosphotransferase